MPEPVPISERIAEQIYERLRSVRDASGNPLNLIVEYYNAARGNTPAHGKCIIIQGDDDPDDPPTYSHLIWQKAVAIDLYVREPEASTVNADRRLNLWRAAIEKAVMTDPQWSGFAMNTALAGAQRWREANEHYGMSIFLMIQYRTSETDPNSVS